MRAYRPLRLVPFGERDYLADVVENDDGTFDLIGVEILSAGGPIHGVGSPPEGDYWTLDELREMAAADSELGEEILPPNKIGHPDEQTLVRNSIKAGDLPQPENDELPAVGWLEDLRVDGSKLLADVRKVPRLVKDAITKGAYRTRSVELSRVTSQVSGKTYDWVVTGLAWLGGEIPAVKTLGDVAALYQGDVPIRRRAVIYQEGEERRHAAGDVVWSPEDGLEYLRSEINSALNPGPASMDEPSRYWVRDVSEGKALVEDWQEEAGAAWVIPFTLDDGRVTLAASSDWIRAEEGWLEVGRQNVERARTLSRRPPDTRAKMRYTVEQRRTFAEATGIAESDVTDEMLKAAGVPEPAEVEGDTPGGGGLNPPADEPTEPSEPTEPDRQLVARVTALEAERQITARRAFLGSDAVRNRVSPGQRKDLEKLWDANPDAARAFVEGLPKREDLDREYGVEEGDDPDEERAYQAERDYRADASARLGIPEDALV